MFKSLFPEIAQRRGGMEVGSQGRWFWEGVDGIPGGAATQTVGTSGMGDSCAEDTCLSIDFV